MLPLLVPLLLEPPWVTLAVDTEARLGRPLEVVTGLLEDRFERVEDEVVVAIILN
jgi:hypothetical protein